MTRPRKPTGGAMPGAGRKPNAVQTYATKFMLTKDQQDMARALGGSPWLQGQLNLWLAWLVWLEQQGTDYPE